MPKCFFEFLWVFIICVLVHFGVQILSVPYHGSKVAAMQGRRREGPDAGPHGMGDGLSLWSPKWGTTVVVSFVGMCVPVLLGRWNPCLGNRRTHLRHVGAHQHTSQDIIAHILVTSPAPTNCLQHPQKCALPPLPIFKPLVDGSACFLHVEANLFHRIEALLLDTSQ